MASTKIRGITIKLAADYNDVLKAFKSIKSQAFQTQRTLTDIQKLLKENPDSKLLNDQQFKHSNKLIAETEEKLKQLKTQLKEKVTLSNYDGDAHKFGQAIDGINREIEHTETLLKKLKNEQAIKPLVDDFNKASNNLDRIESKLSATRSLMTQLPQNAEAVNSSIKQTRDAYDAAVVKAKSLKDVILAMSKQDLTSEQRDELEKLQNEFTETRARAAELFTELKNHPTSLGSTFQSVGSKISGLGSSIKNVGTSLAGVSATITLVGRQAYQMAQDVETSMQKVRSIVVANGDDMKLTYDNLYDSVLTASSETGVAVTDFNEAVYQAISASIDAGKAVNFTTQAVKLARGGFTETTSAVDILTTVINAYGLQAEDAERISNSLMVTQNRGKTTVDLLSTSLGKVVPSASSANVSFEQLSASMAVLTKNGISTQLAGTAIRSLFDEMNKSGSNADKALRELSGQGFSGLMNSGKSLSDVLLMLNDYAKKSGKSFTDMFSNVRSRTAAVSLMTENGEEFNKILQEMYTNQTACNEAFNTMDNTPAVQMQKSINKLKNTMADLGKSIIPTVQKLAEKLVTLAQKFEKLDDGTKETIINLAMFTAAASPAAMGIGGLIEGVGKATEGFGKLYDKLAGASRTADIAADALGKTASVGSGAAGALMSFGPAIPILLGVAGALGATYAVLSNQDWYQELKKQQKELEKLKQDTKEYTQELKHLADDDDVETTEARATAARRLVDEYKRLASGTERTSGTQQKMKAILEQLNSLYPDLTLSIETGTQAIEDQIDAAEKNARIQAINELLTESYKKMAEAQVQIVKQEEYVNSLSKTRTDSWGVELDNEEYVNASRNLEELKNAYASAQETASAYENELSGLMTQQSSASESCANMADQMQATSGVVEGAAQTYSSAADLYADLADDQKATMGAFVEAVGTMQTNLETSITNSMQLFSEWNGGAEQTFSDVITNLTNQTTNLRQWEQDMNTIFTAVSTATGNSLNVDMYNEILNAGPSNANAVRSIAQQIQDTGGTAIDDLNTAWADRADAMSLVGDTNGAQLLENSTAAIGKAMEGVVPLFQTSGEQTWQGFANGMAESISEATAAAQEGSDEVIDTTTDAFDEHSPSRVFDKIGMYAGMGLAQGMNKERSLVKTAALNLAQAANIQSYASMLRAGAIYVGNMVGAGLAQGMNQQLGQVKRIAAEMMSTVTSTMQTKGQICSPSKITKWQGQMLGDGLVIGMKDKMNEVARTAATMMDIPTTAAAMTNSNVNNLNQVNNTTINVSGAGNPNAVADAVMREIQKQMTRRSAVWA